jgi:hypothetical protein
MPLYALTGFSPQRPGPYLARSTSDRTDKWTFWIVVGAGGVNALGGTGVGAVSTSRTVAEELAREWNSENFNSRNVKDKNRTKTES